MPELPDATRTRLRTDYGLSAGDVDVLMSIDSGRDVKFDGEPSRGAVAYFDELCAGRKLRDPKVVVNWYCFLRLRHIAKLTLLRLIHKLLGKLALLKQSFKDNHLSVEQLGELIDMVQSGAITGNKFHQSASLELRCLSDWPLLYRNLRESYPSTHGCQSLSSHAF